MLRCLDIDRQPVLCEQPAVIASVICQNSPVHHICLANLDMSRGLMANRV